MLYLCPVKQSRYITTKYSSQKKSDMRIDLDEWAKEYAKRKKKDKKKSPVMKLRGIYKGRMHISKDAFDYRIIPLNELPD